jgi:polyketide synthase PksL
MPIRALKTQCARSQPGAAYYSELRKRGLDYGPTFQTIQEIYLDQNHALSRLKIADQSKGEFDQFILHPSLIDGALQTVAGLLGGLESGTPHVPFALDEVDIVHPVPQTCYAYAEYADSRGHDRGGVGRFNIRLLNESGEVLIRIKNLYVRPLAKPLMGGDSLGAAELAATGRLPGAAGERVG